MMSRLFATLPFGLFALISISAAFQYDLTCTYGISATQCSSTHGTYCSPRGVLLQSSPSGLDCTTHRSPEARGSSYCYCEFQYVAPPKPSVNFNPNEVLPTGAAVPLATPSFDPNEFLQWASNAEKKDTAAAPISSPSFDASQILQWARDVKDTSKDKSEVSNDGEHFRNAGQLPTWGPSSASNLLGSLSAILVHTSRLTKSATATSFPATSTHSYSISSTHLTTSTRSATSTSSFTPILPSKSGAACRKFGEVLGMLGVVAVAFTVSL